MGPTNGRNGVPRVTVRVALTPQGDMVMSRSMGPTNGLKGVGSTDEMVTCFRLRPWAHVTTKARATKARRMRRDGAMLRRSKLRHSAQ